VMNATALSPSPADAFANVSSTVRSSLKITTYSLPCPSLVSPRPLVERPTRRRRRPPLPQAASEARRLGRTGTARCRRRRSPRRRNRRRSHPRRRKPRRSERGDARESAVRRPRSREKTERPHYYLRVSVPRSVDDR
jgi:hypothetical protein